MRGLEECFELVSAVAQGQVRQIDTSLPEHVDREQNRRPLTGRPDRIPSRAAEPFLESAEVRPPVDVTISPSRSVSSGRSRPALTSSGKPGARSFRFLLSSWTAPLLVRPSMPRNPSSLGSYRHCSPRGRVRSNRASIGSGTPVNTLAGAYSSLTTGDGGSAKRLPGGSVTDASRDARACPGQAFYHVGRELKTWKATRLKFHPPRQPGF
jgi:hypothetical protein